MFSQILHTHGKKKRKRNLFATMIFLYKNGTLRRVNPKSSYPNFYSLKISEILGRRETLPTTENCFHTLM